MSVDEYETLHKNSINNVNGMDRLKKPINELMDKKGLPKIGNKNRRHSAG